MPPAILGLHHVTATVDDAQDDLNFCLGRIKYLQKSIMNSTVFIVLIFEKTIK